MFACSPPPRHSTWRAGTPPLALSHFPLPASSCSNCCRVWTLCDHSCSPRACLCFTRAGAAPAYAYAYASHVPVLHPLIIMLPRACRCCAAPTYAPPVPVLHLRILTHAGHRACARFTCANVALACASPCMPPRRFMLHSRPPPRLPTHHLRRLAATHTPCFAYTYACRDRHPIPRPSPVRMPRNMCFPLPLCQGPMVLDSPRFLTHHPAESCAHPTSPSVS